MCPLLNNKNINPIKESQPMPTTNEEPHMNSNLDPFENLYLKFILTLIAIFLSIIAYKMLSPAEIEVTGNIDVSGDVDTYEQNSIDIY